MPNNIIKQLFQDIKRGLPRKLKFGGQPNLTLTKRVVQKKSLKVVSSKPQKISLGKVPKTP